MLQTILRWVVGNKAHGAADSGNPVKIGGKANAAAPAAVDEGDRTDASYDLQGQLRTLAAQATHDNLNANANIQVGNADVANGNPVPISDAGGSITVDGTLTADLTGDHADLDSGAGTDEHEVVAIGLPASGGHVVGGTSTNPLRTDPTGTTTQPVSDAGGSLTVDGTVTAAQATHDSLNLNANLQVADADVGNANPVPVSDAGGSLTVDGTVTATMDGDKADLDSGAGTDNHAVVAIGLPASGGHAVGGTSTNPIRTDPTGTTTQPVSDAGGSLTVDGTVAIDQTTPGTTNGVQVVAALPAGTNAIGKLAANSGVDIGDVDVASIAAGSNIIGKVGIDQTTPGTTNGVQVVASLPAGTNAIGKLAANSGVDIGDVDVTSLPALPTGSNIVGQVGIDQTTPGTTNGVTVNKTIDLSTSVQSSSANTAQTITIAAVAGQKHRCFMVEVSISGAAAGNDISVQLKDGATVKWQETIGNAAAVGERVGFVTSMPIAGTANTAMTLVVAAGGASVVTVANIGYTTSA